MNNAQAPHLLLLPGLLNDRRLWARQVDDLADICTPVVADLTGADSIALLASDALAQVPAERFTLAGLSMGGYVALEIMRQAPERVQGLALLDTMARPDNDEATENRHRLMALAEKDFPRVTETLLPRLVHPDRLRDTELVSTIESMAEDLGKDVFFRQQRAIIDRIDSRPFLPQIECPALVLCGREDAIAPVEIHEEMGAAIPDATLMVIEHCGHLSTLERPEEVSDAMRSWLTKVVTR
jgi:pimeloyl-ACP methyl ester carboxylesterase